MKIVRNTPEQLIIRNAPWAIGIVLALAILAMSAASLYGLGQGDYKFAAIMFACGPVFTGLFFALFVRRDDLILDRSRNLLELRHATVRGRQKVRHDLTYLEKAVVQTQGARNRGSSTTAQGPTHRVAIVLHGGMDAGTHPITPVYASGNAADLAAKAINAWLAMDVDSSASRA